MFDPFETGHDFGDENDDYSWDEALDEEIDWDWEDEDDIDDLEDDYSEESVP